MPNYLDDFICDSTIEELIDSYISEEMWEEVEWKLCREMKVEAECYDD